MNRRELAEEGVDLKLVFLLLLKKIPTVIVTALAGALLCGALYGIWHSRALGRREYEARSQYYITFEEIEDKSFFDYCYNGYTWNDLLSSDLILGYAMALLPEGWDREEVDACVEAEILSDVRVLTTTVSAESEEKARLIQQAVEQAVVHYAQDGEKLERIEVIRSQEPKLEELADHMLRAAATGAVGFAAAAVLLILFFIALEDAVYLPQQFEERFGIPCAGADCGAFRAELAENEKRLCGGEAYPVYEMEALLEADASVFESIRESGGVILAFPQGKPNGKRLSRALHNLRLQGCTIVCAKMTAADDLLLRRYYGRRKKGAGTPGSEGKDAGTPGSEGKDAGTPGGKGKGAGTPGSEGKGAGTQEDKKKEPESAEG